MGIVIDFNAAKKVQERKIKSILRKSREDEKFIRKFKKDKSKKKGGKIKQKTYQEYQVDENTTVRLFNDGGYFITKIY